MSLVKIGVQGDRGSFSEDAALIFAKNHGIKNYEIIYQVSSINVLKGIENQTTQYGIFAMENAQGGVVIESVEALAAYSCKIVEMFHIPISQNLLSLEDIYLGDITEIHSHQQALMQCKNYLAENFWSRNLIEESDTAIAAKKLSDGLLPSTAGVIGNKACANLYGLKIIESDIHDLKNNLTLFLGVEPLDA